jgi:uncharacterized protein YtpQ (UPF0354 family)
MTTAEDSARLPSKRIVVEAREDRAMRWVILAVVIAAIVGTFAYRRLVGERLMTKQQFADAVKHRISEAYPQLAVKEANGLEFVIVKDGKESSFYLDNTYQVYRLNPKHCPQIIDDFLNVMTAKPDIPVTWEEARPRLMPSLKSRQFLEETRQLRNGAEYLENLVVLDYSKELCVLIAIDSERSIAFATKEQLSKWGVSAQEAFKCSVENLGKLTAPLWSDATEVAHKHGFFAFNTMDGYDASRLLLPDFYQRASQALGCDRIAVGVPNRDYIAAFPAGSPGLPRHAEKIKNDFAAYDHAISPNLIYLPE